MVSYYVKLVRSLHLIYFTTLFKYQNYKEIQQPHYIYYFYHKHDGVRLSVFKASSDLTDDMSHNVG